MRIVNRNTQLDYDIMVQEALRNVVKEALTLAESEGLPGTHHYYISFISDYPGVDVPSYLKNQYPDEITIVLQYEFWDLEVSEDRFSVTLCFNDVHERLTIPLGAIISFADPSVDFGLQFEPKTFEVAEVVKVLPKKNPLLPKKRPGKKPFMRAQSHDDTEYEGPDLELPVQDGERPVDGHSNVVTLDAFRKK